MFSKSGSLTYFSRNCLASDAWLRGSAIATPDVASGLERVVRVNQDLQLARLLAGQLRSKLFQIVFKLCDVFPNGTFRMPGSGLAPIDDSLRMPGPIGC